MDDRLYWVWLSERLGAGKEKFGHLYEQGLSAKEIHGMNEAEIRENISTAKADVALFMDKDLAHAQKIANRCAELRMRILTPEDEAFPKRLLDIFAPPYALYVWGELPPIDEEVVVAFVGSRKASDYGRWAVERLAYDVTAAGALVISGMAVGVDAAAHRGALKAGGKTVGVFGCGLDVGYPAQNRELMRFTIKNGALVSEYPPGTMPLPRNFPIRNRIISALSNGVVVAEAPKKSGALITARYAVDQGRDVFAVPSNIHLYVSEGSNHLIKMGAKLTSCAYDILEEYEGAYSDKLTIKEEYKKRLVPSFSKSDPREQNPPVKEKRAPGEKAGKNPPPPEKEADLSALSKNERAIYEAVQGGGARTPDELVETLSLTAQQVNASLTMLELKGLVARTSEKTLKISL